MSDGYFDQQRAPLMRMQPMHPHAHAHGAPMQLHHPPMYNSMHPRVQHGTPDQAFNQFGAGAPYGAAPRQFFR
jgi:hypothetical protein